MKAKSYKLVFGKDQNEIEDKVNQKILSGFVPHGNLMLTQYGVFIQPMIKYEELIKYEE